MHVSQRGCAATASNHVRSSEPSATPQPCIRGKVKHLSRQRESRRAIGSLAAANCFGFLIIRVRVRVPVHKYAALQKRNSPVFGSQSRKKTQKKLRLVRLIELLSSYRVEIMCRLLA